MNEERAPEDVYQREKKGSREKGELNEYENQVTFPARDNLASAAQC